MNKLTTTSTLFICALISLSLSACLDDWGIKGEGPVVTEERSLAPFSGVQNSLSAEVHISQGPQEDIRIEAQENILANMITRVKNGRLEIVFDENVRRHDGIKIWITIPEIKEIAVSGSGELYSDGVIEGEAIEVNISGSGDVDLLTEVQSIEANVSGSGEVKLAGSAEEATFSVAGSGEIRALEMPLKQAKVYVSGSGDCHLEVLERLGVSISGSGNVRYRGRPLVNSSISGSGDLEYID